MDRIACSTPRCERDRRDWRASSACPGRMRSPRLPVACRRRATQWGGESILPYSYGGSNGLLTQDTSDATLFRRLGASRLARTVCAAPTGAANMAMYGKMPSVTYEDYPEARLIIVWGANPTASGIHLVPYIREAQRRGAKLVVVDPRTTTLARQADIHLAVRPGTDLPVALSIHRFLFEEGHADEAFLAAHTRGAERLRERAKAWTFERAAAESGVDAGRAANSGRVVRVDVAGAGALRMGPGTQSERRQFLARHHGAARGRRKVRRTRRRLHDEQLRVVGDRSDGVDSCPRSPGAHREHEPPGARAPRVHRIRPSRSSSSTTATRLSRRRTRAGSSRASSATTCSRSCSIR